VLDEFGFKLIELATPVWRIQAGALERQESQDFTNPQKKKHYRPKKKG
jgi:hypothetical protein